MARTTLSRARSTRWGAGVVAVGASLGVAACGDDHHKTERRDAARPQRAALQAAWSAKTPGRWRPAINATVPWAWTTPGSIVVAQRRALVSYSTASGARRWTTPLPDSVCNVAPAPNGAGVAAVLLGRGTGVDDEACASVAAVDTKTGRLLWRRSLRGKSTYGMTDVAIGPDAVAVTNACDRALTFSVRDGSPSRELPARQSKGCLHAFASDGTLVADGRRHVENEAIDGYSAASGKRLWTVPVHADIPGRGALPVVERVIGQTPPVVDASINSHRLLWRIDPGKRTLTAFGRQGDDSYPPTVLRSPSGRVVVQYGGSSQLYAFDPATGRQVGRAMLGLGARAAGVRDAGVVTTQSATSGAPGLVVGQLDPSGGAAQMLGTARLRNGGAGADVAVSEDRLFVTDGDELVAFRLPARGPAARVAAPRLARGDIAPSKVADLCTGVTPATERALGFGDPGLAAPASCEWTEPVAGGGTRQMHVTATGVAADASQTGAARAHDQFVALDSGSPEAGLGVLEQIAGLGDEAATATSTKQDQRLVRVVARVANVVITVDAFGDDVVGSRRSELRVVRRGARLAVADLVAEVKRRG